MNPIAPSSTPSSATPDLGFRVALELLASAFESAQSSGQNVWEFAVETQEFFRAGVTATTLRWMVSKGYADHRQELSARKSSHRNFRRLSSLAFPANTCFVLTEKGRTFLSGTGAETASLRLLGDVGPHVDPTGQKAACPRWDPDLRLLSWRGVVVKHFRVPAQNQETILSALEEEGWPPRIDDPLPQTPNIAPRCRLAETLKALNRHQKHTLLHFRGDGTGKGIMWTPSLPD
jgi:hypothetical protein